MDALPYITTSRKIYNLPHLDRLLGAPICYYRDINNQTQYQGVIAWGRKPSAVKAQAFAKRHQLPVIRIEDGFLRSVGLGNNEPPLSLVMDDLGIYYDATTASRLELLIAKKLTEQELQRCRNLVSHWRLNRVSKYNLAREFAGALPSNYVLVCDQTFGDASIEYGLANASHFETMLDAALAENPDCEIWLKIHPDVVSGAKRGYFDIDKLTKNPRIVLLTSNVHPVALIEHAQAVYCVTSQTGFEALLWGKRVRTFGMPFYAGWGLTHDELPALDRRCPVALENLAHAALIDYPRYLNPETDASGQAEDLINWMGLQRQHLKRFPEELYAHGFSSFKKQLIRRFFQGSQIHFVRRLDQIPDRSTLLIWGNTPVELGVTSTRQTIKLLRLEDGFLRSVGLGADYQIRPLSWIADSRGMYYDPSQESDLEHLLQTSEFTPALLDRAKALRKRIVEHGLTKYNVGNSKNIKPISPSSPDISNKRNLILVPGQVETDASILTGAPNIRHNIALLRAVRTANPGAYVIYKPHPDVVAGLRDKGMGENEAELWCDEIVLDGDMDNLLNQADEVHVLTSLTGFEALLRGKRVTCYGQPFYAGWGLTLDQAPMTRRTRKLTLDELVAGALILYPLYLSPSNNRLISAERAVEELRLWKTNRPPQKFSLFHQIARFVHKRIKNK